MFRIIKIPGKYCMAIAEGTAAVIAGAISAGASLAGTGASIGATSKLNKKNRDWQEKMYKQQVSNNREDATTAYERQLELLRLQGEPEQIRRMKLAGLNPALMYDNGPSSMSGGSAPLSSPASVPGVSGQSLPDFSGIGSAGAALGSIPYNRSAINKLNQDAQASFEQGLLFAAQAKFSGVQFEKMALDLRLAKDKFDFEVRMAAAAANAAETMVDKNNFDLETAKIIRPMLVDAQRLSNLNLEAGYNLTLKEILLKDEQINLTAKQAESVAAQARHYDAMCVNLAHLNKKILDEAAYYRQLEKTSASQEKLNESRLRLQNLDEELKKKTSEIDAKMYEDFQKVNLKLSKQQVHEVRSRMVSRHWNDVLRTVDTGIRAYGSWMTFGATSVITPGNVDDQGYGMYSDYPSNSYNPAQIGMPTIGAPTLP